MVSAIYHYVNQSNSQQLNRSYNFCRNIYCAINMKPIVYNVKGKYTKTSNNRFNTILTFKNNSFISTYIPLNILITVASQSDPNIIVYKKRMVLPAQKNTLIPAGKNNLVLKFYFNAPYC